MPEPGSAQPYSMRELQRLAEAPLRRPWLVLVPLVLVLAGAVGSSFLIAPRYRSSTLILVAPDQMPANFMPQISTERMARRLQTLRQEIQSRTRLETVARDLDPYGTLGKEPLISTIERMRGAVTVSVKGNDAFSIEFEHRDPRMAMLVADRLTTLFMEEVAGGRERQVAEAYQFIESQMRGRAPAARAEGDGAARVQGAAHGPAARAGAGQPRHPAAPAARAADDRGRTCARRRTRSSCSRAATRRRPPPSPAGLSARLAGRPAGAADAAALALHRPAPGREGAPLPHRRPRGGGIGGRSASAEPDEPPVDPVAAAAQRRLQEARQEVKELRAAPRRRGPAHRGLPGPGGGRAPARAGDRQPHPRLPEAQRELLAAARPRSSTPRWRRASSSARRASSSA